MIHRHSPTAPQGAHHRRGFKEDEGRGFRLRLWRKQGLRPEVITQSDGLRFRPQQHPEILRSLF